MNKIDQLIAELSKLWLIPNPDAVKVLLSGVIAHYFESDPLWIFLIAPPSSLKTELISGLDTLDDIYQISSLTSQTLFSGLRQTKDQTKPNSLLQKIGNKILTLKDFTTVLSARWEDRAIILGQLREVYDGKYKAKYGNGIEVNWEGRIGMIAGVTPIIDTHSSVFQTLGERFIQYRLAPVKEEDLTLSALDSLGSENNKRQLAQNLFFEYFQSLDIPSIKSIFIPQEIKRCIGTLASFAVRARSGTVRDSYKKTLEYIPEPEAPARLAKQLATLACALSVVNNRRNVTFEEYAVVLKVGLDCIPRQRMTMIQFLCSKDREVTTTETAEAVCYSVNGAAVHLEDLAAHDIFEVDRQGQGHANMWSLSKRTEKYLTDILPVDLEENEINQLSHEYGDFWNHALKLLMKKVKKEFNISMQGVFSARLEDGPNYSSNPVILASQKSSPNSMEDIADYAQKLFNT